jgi:glutamate N-acetyltransferase/amino-acid N-acetyltransferase
VNLPGGYRYSSAYAGIRKNADQDDLALIVSDNLAEAAVVFTQNMVQAAPIRRAKENLKRSSGKVSAGLVNAGNANCATRTGDKAAEILCEALAELLRTKPEYILPASTGVIGVELDSKLIVNALPVLVEDLSAGEAAFEDAARAIMTTDTRMKVASEQVSFRDTTITVAGMTKGSGMIHPNMATTLGFVLTDAAISAGDLRSMLVRATARSYNSLTVDGDTSTNDMVALLANGAARLEPDQKERTVLEEVITWVMESLAEQIAADGEGARKMIIVRALGFMTDEEAHRVASAVAKSPLVKTAVAGSDPNWGRILAAAGYSGVPFNPADVDIHLQRELVCKGGLAVDFDEEAMREKLNSPEVRIRVTLNGPGNCQARFFTCDLTEGYIEINGSYRT